MQSKLIAMAIVSTIAIAACSRPLVVQTPTRDVVVPVAVPTPYAVEVPVPAPMPETMPAPMPATMSLHDSVHAALMNAMGASANGIEVRVDGSRVYLSGHVATRADHNRAHQVAHDVAGVSSVDHSGLKVP